MKRVVSLLSLGCVLTSCATVHSAYMTNMNAPSNAGRIVEAETTNTVFLAFNFSNDYALQLRSSLASQCPGGVVTGILTTFESYWYVFVTKYVVHATGTCLAATQMKEARR